MRAQDFDVAIRDFASSQIYWYIVFAMPNMMKYLLNAIACCLAIAGSAQNTYNHDSDGDGCITVIDVLSILSVFGGCDTTGQSTGYYFHGGGNNYPAHFDLTSDLEGNQTYYFDSGSGFTPTTDFDVAMSYVMDNLGTLGNGYSNEYEIKEFSIPIGGIPALGLEDVLYFDANDEGGEIYYIVLPDGQVDLTEIAPLHLFVQCLTNAAGKKSFIWNGESYWVYKLGNAASENALSISFSHVD